MRSEFFGTIQTLVPVLVDNCMNIGNMRRRADLTPDIENTRRVPETMERELIFGMIKSYFFYLDAKKIVCPFDKAKGCHRRDFITDRYNYLFQAISAFYWRFEYQSAPTVDFCIPPAVLAPYVIDWGNRNRIPEDVARTLSEEILDELPLFDALTLEQCDALIRSKGFEDWISKRVMEHTITTMNMQHRMGTLSKEVIVEHLVQTQQNLSADPQRNIVDMRDIINGSQRFYPAISTGFIGLDAALGGGLRHKDVTLIAGINAGGKTVLAQQMARVMAYSGYNIAVFTTEEPPAAYGRRMLADVTSTDYGSIMNRSDTLNAAMVADAVDVPFIPSWMLLNCELRRQIEEFLDITDPRIKFVDWSQGQGYSIVEHFENAMDAMVRKYREQQWTPDVVIFDWIGGGLAKNVAKDQIRHVYKESVDFIVSHCKRTDRIAILLAQLNKSQVKPSTVRITGDMLSECKTMTDTVVNFIGITALREVDDNEKEDTKPRLRRRQFFYVDKARHGQGGKVPVDQVFKYQRFANVSKVGAASAAANRLVGGDDEQ